MTVYLFRKKRVKMDGKLDEAFWTDIPDERQDEVRQADSGVEIDVNL